MFRISGDNGAGGDWIRGEPSLSVFGGGTLSSAHL